MPPPSVETLRRLASETGHQLETLEKVLRLFELLTEINRDPDLSGRLALKGGTALNAFQLDLDRLSVDIDLNYVGALERSRMLADRVEIESSLTRLLMSLDYVVRRQPDEHAGGKWLSAFSSVLGGNGTLEVDINYMARQPLFGTSRMQSAVLGGIRARDVLLLDLHEIVAGKLVALFDRCAGRDLFDAQRILSIDTLDWSRIKAAVLAIGACARRDWRTVSVDLIDDDPRRLRQNLSLCLPRGSFGTRKALDSWIKDTATLCRQRLAFLFDLTGNERAFLDGVLDRGEIHAERLDTTPDVQERIRAMPMLAWKCRNVRGDVDDPDDETPPDEDPVVLPIEDHIDLHPFAPRDIPSVVEEYVWQCHEEGLREVRIIHGRGKGVQRRIVQSALEKNPLVESCHDAPPERGGWGATVAVIRDKERGE